MTKELTCWSRHEAQRDAIQSQNFNMESTQLTTDNLRGTMATVDAMKSANKEMKKQYGKIDVNQIEVRLLFSCWTWRDCLADYCCF